MPIYEYACQQCGGRFERRQSIHDAPIEDCPTCSGRVRRVIHPAGIVFKGSGFYSTDYKRSGEGGKAASEDNGGTPAATTTETKSAEPEPSSAPATATTGE